jgi:predicted PurR-regulated permease PerM
LAPQETWLKQIRNVLVVAGVIVALKGGAPFFQPLAIAVLLAFVLAPVADWLERRGLPRVGAVALTLVLFIVGVSGLTFVVGSQVMSLADAMPRYEANILAKVKLLKLPQDSPFSKLTRVLEHVQATIEPTRPATDVRVVPDESAFDRLHHMLGPFAEYGEQAFFIFLLIFLLLLERDSIGERILKLAGQANVSATTKSFVQIAERLSRYLARFSLVNLITGFTVGVGLAVIGLPYAVLWGAIGGLLRYIPYIGPTVAFMLPVVFSVAHFDGWVQPLLVVGWYLLIEAVTTALEPVLYGKSTGVTALGLVISALFWTSLWGGLGLLIATPLTVCLVVMGSLIPAMRVFTTLLSEEVDVGDDVRLYQRLISRDDDGVLALLTAAAERGPIDQVFDNVVVPALGQAARDRNQGRLNPADVDHIHSIISAWLEDLSETPEALASLEVPADLAALDGVIPVSKVVGVAASGTEDLLVLRMLDLLVERAGVGITLVPVFDSPLALGEKVQELGPELLVLSFTSPQGVNQARYLTKRLAAQINDLTVIVGLWQSDIETSRINETLHSAGAHRVATNLAAARDQVFEYIRGRLPKEDRATTPVGTKPALSTS